MTPWTVARQAPLSLGFPEYWTGLPLPSPGGLLHSGIEFMPPALPGGFFTTRPAGKPKLVTHGMFKRFPESEAVPLFRKWQSTEVLASKSSTVALMMRRN